MIINLWHALRMRFCRYLGETFIRLGYRYLSVFNNVELQARKELVSEFVYEILPTLDDHQMGNIPDTIRGGSFNLFPLSGGEEPVFDFFLASLPLYIVVAGVESSSWEEARLRGTNRISWEKCQSDLTIIEESIPDIRNLDGEKIGAKVMVIRWNDPISVASLTKRFREL